MFQRLHTRLAAGYIILVAGVFLLLGAYLTWYVQDLQSSELRDRLESQAWLVAEAARPLIAADETPSLDALARRTGAEIGARVTIIAQSGAVLGDSQADTTTMENHAGRPEVAAALRGQVGESERQSATVNRDLIYVAVPITDNNTVIGVARVAQPSDLFTGWLHRIVAAGVAGLAIAVVAIGVLSVIVARLITGPLREIIRAAKRVASGDLTARASESAPGELADLAVAFNEMTDVLRTNIDAIEGERARLEAVVEHLADGILLIDENGLTVLINSAAEQLLGVRRARVVGRPYALAARDHELVELIGQARSPRAESSRVIELVHLRRSVEALAYAIPHPRTPLVVVLRDVTEMRRTDAIRRDFVANVSHELRTPIASLKALVDTLLDGALEDEDAARDFLARMQAEVDGLAALVHDLLDLSRAESGRITLNTAPADIRTVAERVLDRLRTQAQPKGIELQAAFPDELPLAIFDPERIEQVLLNLVHNAVKFTPYGGTVTVGADVEGRALVVWVNDTGPGLPQEELERIFERFYKADRSRSDAGTGLGLAIARHLVQLHGGRIWAESVPRRGATFKFTLPLAAASVPSPLPSTTV